jgi:cytoskeletal protein CcmA (bactofilin family)
MWGAGKKKSKGKRYQSPHVHFDTLVSSKTQIQGDLQFSGGLHIDGLIQGTIRAEEGSEAIVRISDIGEIDGDVIAPHIIVNGTVHGDVYASKHIELASNASIKGNVYYHLIEMAMGAEVNGNLVHHKEPVTLNEQKSIEDKVEEEDSTEPVSLKAITNSGSS